MTQDVNTTALAQLAAGDVKALLTGLNLLTDRVAVLENAGGGGGREFLLCKSTLPPMDVNKNVDLVLAAAPVVNEGLACTADSAGITVTGSVDRVEVRASIHFAIDGAANIQRPAPVLELYRDGALLTSVATGYIRDNSDHEEASWTLFFDDESPGVDPLYTFKSRMDTTRVGVVTSTAGAFVSVLVVK